MVLDKYRMRANIGRSCLQATLEYNIRQFVLSLMGKQSKPVGCFYSIDKKETVDNLYQQSSLSIQNV